MNSTSTHLAGIGVSPGIASGPVEWLAPPPAVPPDLAPARVAEREAGVAGEAVAATADDLGARSSSVVGPAADVLAAQAMMARDPVLGDRIAELAGEGPGA